MDTVRQNRRCRMLLSRSNFMEEYLALESWFKSDSKWVFRGHASSNWRLTNTLERQYKSLFQESFDEKIKCMKNAKSALRKYYSRSDGFVINKLEIIEKRLIDGFKKNIGEDCAQDSSMVKYMALMQHYGLPTRLLDFSRSPSIALFFALCNQGEEDRGSNRVVWAINTRPIEAWIKPYKIEMQARKECEESEIELKIADELVSKATSPTRLKYRWYPIYMEGNNLRMIAQKGLFMMSLHPGHMEHDLAETLGYEYNPYETKCIRYTDFEQMSDDEKARLTVMSIEFPISADSQAKSILKTKGISWEKMFPDLSLVGWLKNELV